MVFSICILPDRHKIIMWSGITKCVFYYTSVSSSPRSMAIRIVHSTKDGKIAAYVCKWIVHRYWDWMCVVNGMWDEMQTILSRDV